MAGANDKSGDSQLIHQPVSTSTQYVDICRYYKDPRQPGPCPAFRVAGAPPNHDSSDQRVNRHGKIQIRTIHPLVDKKEIPFPSCLQGGCDKKENDYQHVPADPDTPERIPELFFPFDIRFKESLIYSANRS